MSSFNIKTKSNQNYLQTIEALNKTGGGIFTNYLNELELSGLISKDYTWTLKNTALSRFSKHRLSDNYIRFYLKYMHQNLTQIKSGNFEMRSLTSLPNWIGIMGLQVENLILSNRQHLHSLIGLYPDEIICSGPFFQRKTARNKGCQIDYLIQTKLGILYLCEIHL